MIAEILSIGTELLLGQIVNTDAQYLARKLSALGITLYHQTTVGDNPQRVQEALRQAIDRLPEREKKVICLRYFHGLTQERASKVLGVSQVQVSRIEKKALQSLRQLLR